MTEELSWLEVSIIVKSELAEPISEVFGRYAPGGVVIESTEVKSDLEGEGFPIGPVKVSAYLVFNSQVEAKRQKIEEAIWHLSQIEEMPKPRFRLIQETNWAEAWKKHYKPIVIGEHLLVIPSWYEPIESPRHSILIDPGMAFGTGTHPTTQLVLYLLDQYITENHDYMEIFDIGCGTGILSIAALKLGVGRAYGVDIDRKAVSIARENAKLNGVDDRLVVAVGSVEDIYAGAFPIRESPLVLVNVIAPIILRLLEQGLADLVMTGGLMILSGILEEQEAEIIRKINLRGFLVKERQIVDDWVALVAKKETAKI